jgi:beta-glucosidase
VRLSRYWALALCLVPLFAATPSAYSETHEEERARQLVAQMTEAEKFELVVSGKTGVPSLEIPGIDFIDGPNGVGEETPGVTAFPAAVNIGASWEPQLAREYGDALGSEARATGHDLIAAPTINIVRTPLWGRAAETFGEDPYLMASLVAPEIEGIQSNHVMSEVKHFGGYNQEVGRVGLPVGQSAADNDNVSKRWLEEIEFPGFKAAVRSGGAASVMCSYNEINGTPSCQDPFMLDTLREWGLQGFIEPDAELAVRNIVSAINAGVDNFQLKTFLGAALGGNEEEALRGAVAKGEVSMARIEEADRNILIGMIRVGLLENPPPQTPEAEASTPADRELATAISTQGSVLLQNNPVPSKSGSPVLPLSASTHSIAVIGEDAGEGADYEEGGSPYVTPSAKVITPLEGIKARAPEGTTVTYAEGTLGDKPLPVVPSTVLTPSSEESGEGLSGSFYSSQLPAFRGKPIETHVEKTIDFQSTEAPLQPIPGTNRAFSVRWTGTLTPPTTGEYRFSLTTSGNASLFIEHKKLITGDAEWTELEGEPPVSFQGVVHLTAGQKVSIRVQYATDDSAQGARLQLGWQPPEPSLREAAVEAARKAEVALVFANAVTSEGTDRTSLSLPGDQNQLIEAVAAANPRTIVVLNTSSAVLMPWHSKVAGIIEAWYPGQQDGEAIAQLLYGDVDPSGHLPVTFPASKSQGSTARNSERYPGVNNEPQYSEGVDVGYRYYDANNQKPLFPFGYGLSYTSFSLSGLSVTPTGGGQYDATVKLANTGTRAGAEVVQLYVGFPSSTGEPPRQLKAFEKVFLQPGESSNVTLPLNESSFQMFDEQTSSWTTVPGTYQIYVGASSRDLPLQSSISITE